MSAPKLSDDQRKILIHCDRPTGLSKRALRDMELGRSVSSLVRRGYLEEIPPQPFSPPSHVRCKTTKAGLDAVDTALGIIE